MTNLMTASLSQANILNEMTTDLWQQVQPRLQQSGIYQRIVACFQHHDLHSDQRGNQRLNSNPAVIQSLLDQMAQTVIDLVSEVNQSNLQTSDQPHAVRAAQSLADAAEVTAFAASTATPIDSAADLATDLAADDGLAADASDWVEPSASVQEVVSAIAAPLAKLKHSLQGATKPSPAELKMQRQEARDARLLEIMDLLKQTRQQKGISLTQIHQSTHVTIHQLQLMEDGQLDQLPEDIYLRGFIRRIGNVLGLNGMALASSIPSLEEVEAHTVKPAWQIKTAEAPRGFQSAHLYVAYAALMAGSAGGLNMMLNASQPTATELPPLEPLTESTQPTDDLSYLNPDSLKSLQEIAPPENMPY